MNGEKNKVTLNCCGGSLATVMTTVFVILKFVGVIDWPWIWVLSPIWISFLLTVSILSLFVLFGFCSALIKGDL